MQDQRSTLRLKQLQKYFVPAGIDAKLILQAFKIQQNRRMLASCRARQFAVEQKIQEQVSKLDLLQVTGRQPPLPQPTRKPSFRRGVKEIKVVLDSPMSGIVDVIANDPDSRLYRRELSQLQRFSASSPKQFHSRELSPGKGAYSEKDLEGPLQRLQLQRQNNTDRQQGESLEYYEQLILNNPVLYRKIMMAYNASKRQLERQQVQQRRMAQQQRRETTYDSKFFFKSTLADLSRNGPQALSETKKGPSLLQYREFQLAICLTNRLAVYPQGQAQYRAYICKGNNGQLVKSILKSRPWWSLRSQNQAQACNLVWTEWKRGKFIGKMGVVQDKRGNPVQFEVGCHSKKRQLALLAEKRKGNFRKIVPTGDLLWQKYQKSPQLQNYLKFTTKINDPKFPQVARVVLGREYLHREVQRDHKAHNHLPGCLQLHSKKLLFLNLRNYYQSLNRDVFSILPLTFHVVDGPQDPQFLRFTQHYQATSTQGKKGGNNIWICKPGQNSNRGNGITVLSSLNDIRALITQRCSSKRTMIIQKYMESPFLYNKRKFDIRCYILMTTVNGVLKGYWYEQGYIRTASKEFTLKHLENKFVHLTNDAVQKKGEEYGKFQNYNKVSYSQFEKYLQSTPQAQPLCPFNEVLERMKGIATDLIRSTANRLNPKRREYCFQLFGLDFMLDDRLNPFLIQANSNPCIEVDGAVLGKVIPALLQNVARVAIDPVFPPPYGESAKGRYQCGGLFQGNKMVLVYDSYLEGAEVDNKEEQNNEDMEEEPAIQQQQ